MKTHHNFRFSPPSPDPQTAPCARPRLRVEYLVCHHAPLAQLAEQLTLNDFCSAPLAQFPAFSRGFAIGPVDDSTYVVPVRPNL
jgi:hypothetical protein